MANFIKRSVHAERPTYDLAFRSYMVRIFAYMSAALAITGITSYFTFASGFITYLYLNNHITVLGWLVTFAPVVMVMLISSNITNLNINSIRVLLSAYSFLIGLSLSSIFMVYATLEIARVFFITAILFLTMSIYGYTTKKDLTSVGSFMMMGLIGIIIASLVNLFLRSPAIYFVTSIISIFIFIGLTAYDVQRLKDSFDYVGQDNDVRDRASLMGALVLYMDFINLFLSLLHIFGKKEKR